MDIEALVGQLPSLKKEAATWRQREEDARRKAESIERIIEGVEGLSGPAVPNESLPVLGTKNQAVAPEPDDDTWPRGIAAVRRVMLEEPEKIWRARDVHTQLEQRGWLSAKARHPLRGTEAAISRLMQRGELERLRPGRYRVTEQMRRPTDEED
jgi:hypothetical protein